MAIHEVPNLSTAGMLGIAGLQQQFYDSHLSYKCNGKDLSQQNTHLFVYSLGTLSP